MLFWPNCAFNGCTVKSLTQCNEIKSPYWTQPTMSSPIYIIKTGQATTTGSPLLDYPISLCQTRLLPSQQSLEKKVPIKTTILSSTLSLEND